MRALGRWSYSWYPWHWPALVFAPVLLGHPLGLAGNVVVVAVSGGLAVLTLRFVENPLRYAAFLRSNCHHLWIKIFYAASSVVVSSSGRSTSLPFSNRAPARTSATRWGALIARQRDWAASISF